MKRLNFYSTLFKFGSLQVVFYLLLIPASFANGFEIHSLKNDTLLARPADTIQVVNEPVMHKGKFWVVTGVHALGYGGSLAALASVWYDDFDQTKLHAFNDMDEWGGMDKLGHVNTAWQLSNFSYALYRYTGMKQRTAALAGASFAMLYQTTLEFFDGYSADWGFSFGDMGANLLGAGLSYMRNTGLLHGVQIKYSWWKTPYPQYRQNVLGKTIPEQMLKDYNAQTYWLSLNLPEKWFKNNRNWLCVSLGYSINGYTGGKQNYFDPGVQLPAVQFARESEFLLSPDIDFSKLEIKKKWVRTVLKVFNVVKLPLPAIGTDTGGKFLFKLLGY